MLTAPVLELLLTKRESWLTCWNLKHETTWFFSEKCSYAMHLRSMRSETPPLVSSIVYGIVEKNTSMVRSCTTRINAHLRSLPWVCLSKYAHRPKNVTVWGKFLCLGKCFQQCHFLRLIILGLTSWRPAVKTRCVHPRWFSGAGPDKAFA